MKKTHKNPKHGDLWLECCGYSEISRQIFGDDKSADTISRWISAKTNEIANAEPPSSRQHFDLWQFQKADGESSYFGKMPPQIVENLLWLYTIPGNIVIDPFAGGGTTIDVCKPMGRRVWASDRAPSTSTLPIHEHNIL